MSRPRLRERADLPVELLVVAAVVVGGGLVGVISVARPALAGVLLVLLVGLVLVVQRPILIAVLAVPGTFVVQRVGAAAATPGSTGGISYSDALIVIAAALSLPALAGTGRTVRLATALAGVFGYLLCLVPTVVLHRSGRADLELVHRAILLGGSLLVGAWLTHERSSESALRLLFRVAGALALAAVVDSAVHGFAPAQAFDLNKNFLGGLLGLVTVLVITVGRTIEKNRWVRLVLIAIGLAGLLATQSRGGMIGAAFGLIVAFGADVRRHRVGARVAMAGVFAALVVLVGYSVRQQFALTEADFANSSAGLRLTVETATRQIWRHSPLFGVGLRYWESGGFGAGAVAANNVVDNELAESGIVGAAGFVLLQGALALALWRRRRLPLAAAALGLVAGQLLHGMVDIYWTAGVVSLCLLVSGMALAGAPNQQQVSADPAARAPDAGIGVGIRGPGRPAPVIPSGARRSIPRWGWPPLPIRPPDGR